MDDQKIEHEIPSISESETYSVDKSVKSIKSNDHIIQIYEMNEPNKPNKTNPNTIKMPPLILIKNCEPHININNNNISVDSSSELSIEKSIDSSSELSIDSSSELSIKESKKSNKEKEKIKEEIDVEEDECIICKVPNEKYKLIKPCNCTGSIKYHRECLQMSEDSYKKQFGKERGECGICKTKYEYIEVIPDINPTGIQKIMLCCFSFFDFIKKLNWLYIGTMLLIIFSLIGAGIKWKKPCMDGIDLGNDYNYDEETKTKTQKHTDEYYSDFKICVGFYSSGIIANAILTYLNIKCFVLWMDDKKIKYKNIYLFLHTYLTLIGINNITFERHFNKKGIMSIADLAITFIVLTHLLGIIIASVCNCINYSYKKCKQAYTTIPRPGIPVRIIRDRNQV